MIKGKSDAEYWESLIAEPTESSVTLRTVAQQMAKDGHTYLVDEYINRADAIEKHEKLILSLGRLDKKGLNDQMWRTAGPRIAGMLIYQGWTPPAELMLTDEGRRVAVAGLCADADETRPT